jgi:short-chain Z-isoprenyl diphosphate synthase
VAFIVDGNRRWARNHGVSTEEGHAAGARKIVEVLGWCNEAGVEITSWWVLSPDNLRRPRDELSGLLRIIGELAEEVVALQRWRVRHIGDPALLPRELAQALRAAQEHTCRVDGPRVNLAVGYGGRRDLTAAVRHLVTSGVAITARTISEALATRGDPDPDLLIRTSGEQRLSDFMIWQTALTELYFSPVLWPDYTQTELARALSSFEQRERRYGA